MRAPNRIVVQIRPYPDDGTKSQVVGVVESSGPGEVTLTLDRDELGQVLIRESEIDVNRDFDCAFRELQESLQGLHMQMVALQVALQFAQTEMFQFARYASPTDSVNSTKSPTPKQE